MIEKDISIELCKRGISISVAESCTGGLLSHKITNIPGSSSYFKGTVIAYDNEVKEKILQVARKTLVEKGAISADCAKEMAEGVRKLLIADIGISTTGIAGPDHSGFASDKYKPVGLVYIALATKDYVYNEEHIFHKTRKGNKEEATYTALNMLKKYLLEGARSSDR